MLYQRSLVTVNRSGNVAAAFCGPHRHRVQEKTDRTEDQQVLLRYSLMNGAERGPDAVGAMIKSLATHLHGGASDQVPPSLSLCHRESCATATSERAALCTMTQKHVVHGQPGCTGNSQMGAVPWMTLVQGSEQAKCK